MTGTRTGTYLNHNVAQFQRLCFIEERAHNVVVFAVSDQVWLGQHTYCALAVGVYLGCPLDDVDRSDVSLRNKKIWCVRVSKTRHVNSERTESMNCHLWQLAHSVWFWNNYGRLIAWQTKSTRCTKTKICAKTKLWICFPMFWRLTSDGITARITVRSCLRWRLTIPSTSFITHTSWSFTAVLTIPGTSITVKSGTSGLSYSTMIECSGSYAAFAPRALRSSSVSLVIRSPISALCWISPSELCRVLSQDSLTSALQGLSSLLERLIRSSVTHLVPRPAPRGKLTPVMASRTELLPADWSPTTTIWGISTSLAMPSSRRLSTRETSGLICSFIRVVMLGVGFARPWGLLSRTDCRLSAGTKNTDTMHRVTNRILVHSILEPQQALAIFSGKVRNAQTGVNNLSRLCTHRRWRCMLYSHRWRQLGCLTIL